MSNTAGMAGKLVSLEVSYDVDTPAWVTLGGCTTKSKSGQVDTVDVTSDDSPGSHREFIETFLGGTISFSIYPGSDETRRAAVDDLEEFFKDPSSQSKTDRCVLFRTVRPKSDASSVAQNRTEVAQYLLTSVGEEFPHDGAAALSFEATRTSAPTITDAAAS